MNKNSNLYTILYASVMVIIVAFVLAFLSQVLKPMQDANVEVDRQSQVLASLNIRGLSNDEVQKKYAEVVVSDSTIEGAGQLFVCNIEGQTKYVIPMKGRGLWGGLWGYIALDADGQTVYGAYMSHESETAGLGALIAEEDFQKQFQGKQVFGDKADVQLTVVKHGKVDKNPTVAATQIDGVTGATLTSNGVANMLKEGLQPYADFLHTLQGAATSVNTDSQTSNIQ